jgi:hypothetical protein
VVIGWGGFFSGVEDEMPYGPHSSTILGFCSSSAEVAFLSCARIVIVDGNEQYYGGICCCA